MSKGWTLGKGSDGTRRGGACGRRARMLSPPPNAGCRAARRRDASRAFTCWLARELSRRALEPRWESASDVLGGDVGVAGEGPAPRAQLPVSEWEWESGWAAPAGGVSPIGSATPSGERAPLPSTHVAP
eukprot:2102466-Prymnesium_polylepis.1